MSRKGYKIKNTKFLRRSVIVICVLVFLVVCVIVTGFMTVVRNVNVSYLYIPHADFASETYEEDTSDEEDPDTYFSEEESAEVSEITSRYSDEFVKTSENLDGLKKSSLIFLGEKKIYGCITEPARIKISSYTKKYPCSLDVVLEERVETFTSFDESENLRTIYDSYGDIMDTVYNDRSVIGDDGSPDIEIAAGLEEYEIKYFVDVAESFEKYFSSARRLISVMNISDGVLYIELRSGIEIVLYDCYDLLDEKIESAYEIYVGLPDWQKTCGRIVTDGICRSVYEEC